MSLRKKNAILIALVIIVSIPVTYFHWSMYIRRYDTNVYERTIIREPANLQEAMALTVAEYFNYSDIFGEPRLTTSSYGTPTWAHFVDAEVVQYYNERFDNLTNKAGDKPEQIRFRYEAKVLTRDQIRVVYVPAPEGTNSFDSKIQVQSIDGSVLLETDRYHGPASGMESAYWNGSDYLRIYASGIDFSFSKSCVVEMKLEYDEMWGPLAGFYVEACQIIVVDGDFVPLLLCAEHAGLVS